ncbi:MAG: formyltetrahydrofolate deformylase [Acidimicrobiia bacterium]|nr:formyltetrahydrofolate deformylase [Acidimicrobiia bacterium]
MPTASSAPPAAPPRCLVFPLIPTPFRLPHQECPPTHQECRLSLSGEFGAPSGGRGRRAEPGRAVSEHRAAGAATLGAVPSNAVLLLSCPDRRGIVAAVADFVARHGGNIVSAEQHTDPPSGVFFQRVEFELGAFDVDRDEILGAFEPVRARFEMAASLRFTDRRTRVAILASRQPHCLYDLLSRWHTDELPMELAVVVSNHPDHAETCAFFGVDYVHLPVTPETKPTQEAAVLQVLAEREVELVVLARYMQILSAGFVGRYPDRVINIHHSFLPAFVGARPYHQAHERGVKIIGVTAHYATASLDEGPIIEQDVVRVSHRDAPEDLVRKGRDLEVVVLARAMRAQLEHRVLVFGRKTVVFE